MNSEAHSQYRVLSAALAHKYRLSKGFGKL
jgi:hypothetical protein